MRGGTPSLDDLADEAAASSTVRSYLKLRGIVTVGTLALVAADESQLQKVLIDPLLSGWKDGTTVTSVPDGEKPIAQAMLLHLWSLARSQWQRSASNHMNTPVAQPAAGTASSPAESKEEKIPKTLPNGVWGSLLSKYNGAQLHGRDRQFPVKELMGAEVVVARLWWEHHRSKLYTPLHLGEILQHRSFQSNGDLNPLAKGQKKLTNLHVEDGSLVQKDESVWQPRSILAVLDGIVAAKWAMILVQLGDELDVTEYCDVMCQRARSRPNKCEQMSLYWSACGWRIAMAMRDGSTFAAASKQIINDYDRFAEHMAKEDSPKKTTGGSKGRQSDPPKGYGKSGKNKSGHRWTPYGKGRWTTPDWSSSPGTSSSWQQRSNGSTWNSWQRQKEWEPRSATETPKDK